MEASLVRAGSGLRAAVPAAAATPASVAAAAANISAASRHAISRSYKVVTDRPRRAFSALNRPPAKYPGHVPLTKMEQAGMAVGSGIMSLFNPYRAGESMFCLLFYAGLIGLGPPSSCSATANLVPCYAAILVFLRLSVFPVTLREGRQGKQQVRLRSCVDTPMRGAKNTASLLL